MKLNENEILRLLWNRLYKYGWYKQATYDRNKLEDCGWIKI